MANRFLSQIEEIPKDSSNIVSESSSEKPSNRFLSSIEGVDINQSDSPIKTAAKESLRTVLQPLLGYLNRYTYPASLLQMGGQGDALAELDELEERLPELKKKFPNAPWGDLEKIDREKYMEAVQAAGESFPTQENIERLIENKTGFPLQPKNTLQKLTRFGGTAAGFKPGNLTQKATAGVAAPIAKAGLQKLGVPEIIADPLALGAGGLTPSPSISKNTKPSGLTTRKFEGLKSETKVSTHRAGAINQAVEKDFKKIADQLLEKNRTYSAMKEDTMFKEKIGDLFGEVENLAGNIEGEIPSEEIRSAIKTRFNKRESKGISPDEYELNLRKELKKQLKGIPFGEYTPLQTVEQFRKNNASLKTLFEPGKSSAQNTAKRDALLEYNRALEDVISKKYPNSEFKDLFEFTNKRWSEISDIEKIDNFMGDVFNGKINYGKAKQILSRDKEHVSKPFKRILGEDGFKDFKTLTEDLLSTEKGMSYIKKAEEAGFTDLAKKAALYMVNPRAAKSYTLSKLGKSAYQMLLDKPTYSITWKNALDSLKKGDYKTAEKEFDKLDRANQTSQPKPQ